MSQLICTVPGMLYNCKELFYLFSLFFLFRLSPDPLLLVSTMAIAGTISLIPWCYSLWLLILDMAIMGIFMGIIDTVANVSLLKIYGKLVSPFLQVRPHNTKSVED